MSAHLTGTDLEAYEREWKVKGHNINRVLVPAQRQTVTVPKLAKGGDEIVVPQRSAASCQLVCPNLNAENARGGEARDVVLSVAYALGIQLNASLQGGEIWSPENMRRVVVAANQAESDRKRLTEKVRDLETRLAGYRAKLTVIRQAAS